MAERVRSRAHVNLVVVALAWLPLAGCASCGPELESELVGLGRFSDLVAVEDGDRVAAVALRDAVDDGGELTILHDDGSSCSAGDVVDHFLRYGPGGRVSVVAYRRGSQDDRIDVDFIGLDCAELAPPIVDLAAPVSVYQRVSHDGSDVGGYDWGEGFYLQTGAGELWLVDPWAATSTRLCQGVSQWFTEADDRSIWCLEQAAVGTENETHTLVQRGLDGSELARLGTQVFQAVRVADVGMLVVEAGSLTLYDEALQMQEVLAEDACEVRGLFGSAGDVSYLSPCSERQLWSLRLDTGEASAIASGVASYVSMGETFFYETPGESGAAAGDLWMASATAEPRFVAARAPAYSVKLRIEKGLPSYLVVADFDGELGRLLRLDAWGALTELHERVAEVDDDSSGLAVLADYEADKGTLWLYQDDKLPLPVAWRVPSDGFVFSRWAPALGYLHEHEGGGAKLSVRYLGDGTTMDVDTGVVEFTEIVTTEVGRLEPKRPGVAYAIGAGPRAGVWFATIQ